MRLLKVAFATRGGTLRVQAIKPRGGFEVTADGDGVVGGFAARDQNAPT
jgi:hypothetical protein